MSKNIHSQLLNIASEKYPRLNKMLVINGVISLGKSEKSDFFRSMARTVAGQQLSKQAATKIWGRVVSAAERHGIELEEFCSEGYAENIRECGLSKLKAQAILRLKQAITSNQIDVDYLAAASHKEIRSEISKLWGFGNWSADMMALFFFGKEDVWAPEDAALKRGMLILSNNDLEVSEQIVHDSRPYRSYLSLHIWKALDDKIFN
ncbi:MAG TPA: DNA-3-methyladenine glycosylase 2 family protein [Porticoccaceae bacterium]|nr:DNA-3-methyladenine glycosylase 2 family protein [Porticoccaceae bacterium]